MSKIQSTLASLAVLAVLDGAIASLALAEGAVTSNEVVAGIVTKVDLARNKVAVRSADGATHEFEASKETLEDLEIGDRIEAKKRSDSK